MGSIVSAQSMRRVVGKLTGSEFLGLDVGPPRDMTRPIGTHLRVFDDGRFVAPDRRERRTGRLGAKQLGTLRQKMAAAEITRIQCRATPTTQRVLHLRGYQTVLGWRAPWAPAPSQSAAELVDKVTEWSRLSARGPPTIEGSVLCRLGARVRAMTHDLAGMSRVIMGCPTALPPDRRLCNAAPRFFEEAVRPTYAHRDQREMMMITRRLLAVTLVPWVLAACPDEAPSTGPTGDAMVDMATETGSGDASPDAVSDATLPDGVPDTAPDTVSDAPPDGTMDAGEADAASDVPAADITPDAGPETVSDGGADDTVAEVSDGGASDTSDAEPETGDVEPEPDADAVDDAKPAPDVAGDVDDNDVAVDDVGSDVTTIDGGGGDVSIGDANAGCLKPGQVGAIASTPSDVPISEFFDQAKVAVSFATDGDYTAYFGKAPPTPLGDDWLVFAHVGRRPYGFSAAISKVALTDGCAMQALVTTTRLGDTCSNFAATWPAGAAAIIAEPFSPHTPEVSVGLAEETLFDCETDGVQAFGTCTEQTWCAPGLICAGITRFSEGLCLDASNLGLFETGPVDVATTDAGTVTSVLDVSGLASVDMDVIVSLTVTHPDPAALTITLTNPATNEVMVWNQEASPYELSWYPTPGTLSIVRVPVGFSGDESVNGTWTLSVSTAAGGGAGTLNSWGLEIMSRLD